MSIDGCLAQCRRINASLAQTRTNLEEAVRLVRAGNGPSPEDPIERVKRTLATREHQLEELRADCEELGLDRTADLVQDAVTDLHRALEGLGI